MDELKDKALGYLRQYRYVLLVAAVGLLLMTLPDGNTDENSSSSNQSITEVFDPSVELEEILTQIQGVGRVQVMLTSEEGVRILYEQNEDRSDGTDSYTQRREVVVITDENRAQEALVYQVIPPVYRGAIIVCQGGDQPTVRLAIVEAVADVTGLTADKITVLKMK